MLHDNNTNTMTMITRYESHFFFLIRSRANVATILHKYVYVFLYVCAVLDLGGTQEDGVSQLIFRKF